MAEKGGGAECGQEKMSWGPKMLSFYGSGQDLSPLGESDGGLTHSAISFWGALLRSIASPGMAAVCASLAMDGIQPPLLDPFVRFTYVRLM